MVDKKKKVGYYASRGRCLRAYSLRKTNRRTRRTTIKKVNSSGKTLKKGTKIFKTKSACKRHINRRRRSPVRRRRRRSPVRRRRRRSPVRRRRRRNRFGKERGTYSVPYFNDMNNSMGVPSIAKTTNNNCNAPSSYLWGWPNQPGAYAYDTQQGSWN